MLVDVRQLSEGYIINIGEVTLKRTTQFLGWGGGNYYLFDDDDCGGGDGGDAVDSIKGNN